VHGAVPATTGYSAFAGAFGIVAGLVGIAALFVDMLNGVISWAVDGLASLILLAGGIAFAIGLKGTKCSDPTTTYSNALLNCGSVGDPHKDNYKYYCAYSDPKDKDAIKTLSSRCREATADDAFLFMAFAVSLAALATTFVIGRKRGGGSYVV